jgi:hypothetical protein
VVCQITGPSSLSGGGVGSGGRCRRKAEEGKKGGRYEEDERKNEGRKMSEAKNDGRKV